MLNEIDVIRDLAHKFAEAGIAYMLTGSMAMNYYAEPRMTRDIDLVIELNSQDVDRFVNLFSPDYYVARESVQAAVAREAVFNMIHQGSVIKVDCILRKSSEYRLKEFARRKSIIVQDLTIQIVSKEDLIISKLFWAKDSHSEMQLRDVRKLLASGYDADYLQSWTARLKLEALLQECLHE